MQAERQDGSAGSGLYLYPWGRGLSAGALKIVKTVLGLALVLVLLSQLLGQHGISLLMDNFFAALFFLSLAGPLRRLLQRRGTSQGRGAREDG